MTDIKALIAQVDELSEDRIAKNAEIQRLQQIVVAADTLYEFLWNERQTFEPPRESLDQDFVALETSADYDKLEQLTLALGKALGKTDAE